jgi:hypothetical protein
MDELQRTTLRIVMNLLFLCRALTTVSDRLTLGRPLWLPNAEDGCHASPAKARSAFFVGKSHLINIHSGDNDWVYRVIKLARHDIDQATGPTWSI